MHLILLDFFGRVLQLRVMQKYSNKRDYILFNQDEFEVGSDLVYLPISLLKILVRICFPFIQF